MSVQVCEGIWRNRTGQRVVITRCEPVGGQQWTDGVDHYSDNGSFWDDGRENWNDLVAFVELLPDRPQQDQTVEIDRLKAEWQSEFSAAQQLRSDFDRLQAEVERLRAEIERSKNAMYALDSTKRYAAQLEGQLDNTRETLRDLQEDHTAMDHRAEGARLAFLGVIKTLWEMRR